MSDFESLVREFMAADAADRQAGSQWSPETEIRRSKAIEAVIRATRCPKCGSIDIDCIGKPKVHTVLWRMNYDSDIHAERRTAINSAANARIIL